MPHTVSLLNGVGGCNLSASPLFPLTTERGSMVLSHGGSGSSHHYLQSRGDHPFRDDSPKGSSTIQYIQVTSTHIIQGVEGKEGNGMVGPMG